ncbi:MAG: methionyl-tRNA formyltransferase [Candidatus Tectimicrobiota bacterium]|nr:MAG: methionyl-tRNA formyltransferase [Candidatus Tectomicrobia bacterium]
MRVLFMGTAAFACPTLSHLLVSSHQVLAVVTQPDRPRGRGQHPAPPPVKVLALEHRLPVLQPPTLRTPENVAAIAAWRPEAIVVVAYGHILPPSLLRLPPYGCLNVHASLLPRYRGPAPINWALIRGETVTGYTIMQMDEQVDTGPILWSEPCPILPEDDALTLGARLAEAGAHGLVHVLTALEKGEVTPRPQPAEGASWAPKLSRALGQVDWQQPATAIHNLVRGLVPWPGATTTFRGHMVKLWRTAVAAGDSGAAPGTVTAVTAEGVRVACGADALWLREVQPANRRRMTGREFAQGYRVQEGDRFGEGG